MPANTSQYAWVCETTRRFETEVESSSSDKTYTVKLGPSNVRNDYQFDWSCTCPAFQYGNGTDENGHCKHIRKVRDSEEYCGWNGMFDSGEPEKDEDGNRKCPECGCDVHSEEWAV
jgi:hypothetical protein